MNTFNPSKSIILSPHTTISFVKALVRSHNVNDVDTIITQKGCPLVFIK